MVLSLEDVSSTEKGKGVHIVKEIVSDTPKETVITNDVISDELQFESGKTDNLNTMFNYQKDSPTIETELNNHNNILGSEIGNGDSKKLSLDQVTENDVEAKPIEDYKAEDFEDTAELILDGIEFVLTVGLNFYYKKNDLDLTDGKEIEANKRQRDKLTISLSKVLYKYNTKFGVEMILVMMLVSVYGAKTRKAITDSKNKVKKSDNVIPIQKDVVYNPEKETVIIPKKDRQIKPKPTTKNNDSIGSKIDWENAQEDSEELPIKTDMGASSLM